MTQYILPTSSPSTSDPDSYPGNLSIAVPQQCLQFVLYLSDPAHSLLHTTITQAIPGQWLEIWDQYDWVEDVVAEALRVGVEVIGQEYVVARMGWGGQHTEGRKQGKAHAQGEKQVEKEEES
jgi:hypothetical protein